MAKHLSDHERMHFLEEFVCQAIPAPWLQQMQDAASDGEGKEDKGQPSGGMDADARRRQLSADPARAAYFSGADLVVAGDWDGALANFRRSLETFIARRDQIGINQASTAIKDVMQAKGAMAMVNGFDQLLTSFRQRTITDDFIWNWWRIHNLPWR